MKITRCLQYLIMLGLKVLGPQLLLIDYLLDTQESRLERERSKRVHDRVMVAIRPTKPVTKEQAFADAGIWLVKVAPELTDPVDDPRMDGETWIDAKDVTEQMLVAWPVWDTEHDTQTQDAGKRHARYLCDWVDRSGWLWRPLRLPGMGRNGIVQADDMTHEHWTRCRWHSRNLVYQSTNSWSSWNPCDANTWDLTMGAQVHFRPTAWPDDTDA